LFIISGQSQIKFIEKKKKFHILKGSEVAELGEQFGAGLPTVGPHLVPRGNFLERRIPFKLLIRATALSHPAEHTSVAELSKEVLMLALPDGGERNPFGARGIDKSRANGELRNFAVIPKDDMPTFGVIVGAQGGNRFHRVECGVAILLGGHWCIAKDDLACGEDGFREGWEGNVSIVELAVLGSSE
jgi:hypothetical protein